MSIKKFFVSVVLTLALAFVLVGCGASDSQSESGSGTTVSTTQSAVELTETSEDNSEDAAGAGTDGSDSTAEENSADSTTASETGGADTADASAETGKILVAYFSATGNTKKVAETIAEVTGGDLYEIVPAEPYTDDDLDYNNDDCRANKEQNDSSARPAISAAVQNMDEYSIIFIGHPIWWGIEPRIVDTFAESYDFSGKTVVNFCTSGGSGIDASTENLKALTPGANWLNGRRFDSDASTDDVQAWLDELGRFE